ncbi:hypothetical protein [Laspinema olomoucense]|uniref:Uncharacterized protein n=1 Tax=Laspinema olomoucense D3b TaxID=2953688 RepID=A0ABT2N7P0_9CYAN|nr:MULTISPECIES: hypothetical protein [unclassified Laspinema]MCT7973171.1 hypothetical protein [Laspinema sp. D3d]MCT7978714.1 hypothetical protein [Laspinema sp. D3b]MCT7990879.1 hypothetical protein [Laspinema sp. D3a]MCT7993191.1 hypothetical protein [Laspinema sp. D3c]
MMKINRPSEKQVIHQALDILSSNLDPSSFARFVAVCQLGEGDYLKTKEQLFNPETVDSLYEKIQAFEKAKNELNP